MRFWIHKVRKHFNTLQEKLFILSYDKRKEIRMAYDLRYGDCFKLLDDIPDKSVDLILTDPPYNIAKYSTGNIDESDFYFDLQWNFNHHTCSDWYIERL